MQRIAGLLAACGALAGCHPPPSSVEADWSNAIARLNYISIYPITEDLQPGDVLLSIPSTGGQPQPTVQRLGSIDKKYVVAALQGQENNRLVIQGKAKPAASTDTAQEAAAKPAANGANISLNASYPGAATISTQVKVVPSAVMAPAAATAAKKKPAPAPDVPLRPDVLASDAPQVEGKLLPRARRVAVPTVAVARVYAGDIGAGGSIGGLGIGGALGLRGDVAVSVYLKDLESLGADSLSALDLLAKDRIAWISQNHLSASMLLGIASQADPALGARLCRGQPPVPGERRAVIQVVNRVLYAHQIQFEYQRGSSFAGKLALDFARSVAAANGTAPMLGTGPALVSQASASGATPTADSVKADAKAQLGDLSSGLTLPSSPGVRSSLGIGSSGEVALSETFDQPMAVGYSTVSSYSVRDSLLYTGLSQEEADEEAARIEVMCRPLVGVKHGGDPLLLSPIETLTCANTVALKQIEHSLVLPTSCSQKSGELRAEVASLASGVVSPVRP